MPNVDTVNLRNYYYIALIEDPEEVFRLIFDENAYPNRGELELRFFKEEGFGEEFIERFLEVRDRAIISIFY